MSPFARVRAAAGLLAAGFPLSLAALGAGCSRDVSGPPNVVLVTLDTTRADHLGCYGNPARVTPEIDRLAARGCRYESALTTAPLTLPAHASLLTGLDPIRHGVRANGTFRLPPSARTLAEELSGAGLDTAAFVSASVLDRQFGLDQGFTTYDDETHGAAGSFFFAERNAREVSQKASRWIRETAHPPFFLWVHFFDPHAPYIPEGGPRPAPRDADSAAAAQERAYLDEIHRADTGFGRLTQAVEERGLAAHTLWIVVADHGESLGEHGEDSHALLLHEATAHIPLVIAGPGVPSGRVSTFPAQITDVFPTVLDMVQGSPPEGIDGRSLRPGWTSPASEGRDGRGPDGGDDRLRVVETCFGAYSFGWAPLFAIREGSWKLVSGSREELFDLEHDPREMHDLHDEPRADATRRRLESALARWMEAGETRALGPAAFQADAHTLRMLEGLGYVMGSGGSTADEDDSPQDLWRRGGRPDPRDRVAFGRDLGKASTWLAMGRCDKALAVFRPLVQADPHNPALVRRYAFALEACGSREDALGWYRSLATLPMTSSARDWNSIGRLLGEMDRLDEAEEALRHSIRLDPEAPDAYVNLGNVFLRRGDVAGAVSAAQEAVRISPSTVMAQTNLGAALIRAGRVAEGARHLREARDLDPSSADAWFNDGEAQRLLGRASEARTCFRKALELDPGHVPAQEGLRKLGKG